MKATTRAVDPGASAAAVPARASLSEWSAEWLELCAVRGLRDSTIESYRTTLRLHVDAALQETPVSDITRGDLNDLYRRLLRSGRRDRRGGLSPRTVRYLHAVLSRCFSDAVRAGYLRANPAATADPPSPRAARSHAFTVWSPTELASFLAAARDDPLYPAFHLAATTGLRRSELLGLRWCDIDFAAGEVHVVQAVVEVAHVPRITPPKTAKSRRLVAIDKATALILAEFRAEAERAQPDLDAQTLAFTTPDGDPIHPALFSYYFQRRLRLSGARRIRFHDLRHTHATHALQAGVHPKVVSERLGHSSILTTLDIYSHVLPSMQREAAEAVAALLST
jgi:integrase